MSSSKCGYVAIVGRPNVGKSTLLNAILGQKISITSDKPQTTRHRILGIKTAGETQALYVDTPGMHLGKKQQLNRFMLRTARTALFDVHVVLFVVDGLRWTDEDEMVLQLLHKTELPTILVINKVDKVKDKAKLLPYIQEVQQKFEFADIIPVSAKNSLSVDRVEQAIAKLLPENDFYYAEDELTDKSERFLVAEIIREKLTRLLGQELPHELAVAIEQFEAKDKVIHISAVIFVARRGQKMIVIGHNGAKLKEVATKARKDIETLIESKVYLQLWVKVKTNWFDSERSLRELGYTE